MGRKWILQLFKKTLLNGHTFATVRPRASSEVFQICKNLQRFFRTEQPLMNRTGPAGFYRIQ
jgi:hypothetical protein